MKRTCVRATSAPNLAVTWFTTDTSPCTASGTPYSVLPPTTTASVPSGEVTTVAALTWCFEMTGSVPASAAASSARPMRPIMAASSMGRGESGAIRQSAARSGGRAQATNASAAVQSSTCNAVRTV